MSSWGGVLFTDNTIGFTLIELLAVIVILAVIALIATPIVLNIIEQARYGAAKSSAIEYKEASEKAHLIYMMGNKNNTIKESCTALNNTLNCGEIVLNLDVKGSLPSSGIVKFSKDGDVESITDLLINGYKFSYSNGKWTGEKGSGGEVTPPTPETEREATINDVGKYVDYTPDNATWDEERDGVTEAAPKSQGKFGGIKSNEAKSKNATCITYNGYGTNKNEGWRVMNVSSSGQITLIHGGTSECYYHKENSEASKTILRTEATSASNEGDGKAWTKYGSSLAQSVHYMTENDYNTILKNKNGNESYYLWDYLEKNDNGTCFDTTSSNCGQNHDLIDTNSYYWLASAFGTYNLYYWFANYQRVDSSTVAGFGVRPVIVLKPEVKIALDEKDGSSETTALNLVLS